MTLCEHYNILLLSSFLQDAGMTLVFCILFRYCYHTVGKGHWCETPPKLGRQHDCETVRYVLLFSWNRSAYWFSSFISGSGVEIVICTSHGEVLEFCNHQIVGVCNISCINPKSVTVFTSYDFECNIFYIIRSENGVIILSRKRGLKVCDMI